MAITKRTKRWKRILLLVVSAIFFVLGLGIYFQKPLRCWGVAWAGFRKLNEHLFVDPEMSDVEAKRIEDLYHQARKRNSDFLGDYTASPRVIALSDETAARRLGHADVRTAVTHLGFWGEYVVLGPDGLNQDVMAHEMLHAEVCHRIGWMNRELHLPVWFDEGFAMQVDYREAYSEDAWVKESDAGKLAPDVKTLIRASDFFNEHARMNFATAKHEVGLWIGKVGQSGAVELLDRLRKGEKFDSAYHAIEQAR